MLVVTGMLTVIVFDHVQLLVREQFNSYTQTVGLLGLWLWLSFGLGLGIGFDELST